MTTHNHGRQRPRIGSVRQPLWTAVAAVTAVGLLPGCGGGDTTPDRYPVSGTVTYNGELLKSGIVSFHPQGEQGKPAFAEIRSDGTFELSTYESSDGAVPGKYKVTVQVPASPGPLIPPAEPSEASETDSAQESSREADGESQVSDAASESANAESPDGDIKSPDDEPEAAPESASDGAAAPSPIPERYLDRETTPLEFEVTTGTNKVELNLTDD